MGDNSGRTNFWGGSATIATLFEVLKLCMVIDIQKIYSF
jgi:hypothetical protein